MLIYFFGKDEDGYLFEGLNYFTSARGARDSHAAYKRQGWEAGCIETGDAIAMLEARDQEIERLRSLLPFEDWHVPPR